MSWFPPLAATGRLRRPPERIVVVIAGPNPSFDYYLAPRLARCGLTFRVVDLDDAPSSGNAAPELAGALVLFCRYVSGPWLEAVEACAGVIAGVGLFVDDDIDALAADSSVPLDYRLRLFMLHLRHRRRLAECCDLLFVSSPVLAQRCSAARPKVLTPIASPSDMAAPESRPDGVRLAFHSTRVHRAEHRWLMRVMRSLLPELPSVSLEVHAGAPLSWSWRRVPRIVVMPPMPWPAYRAASAKNFADLLLAPLLPTRANAARSWTKRIDAVRMGAALLVSDNEVYQVGQEESSLGMCVPFDAASWKTAILELVRDPDRLAKLRDNNRLRVLKAEDRSAGLLDDFSAEALTSSLRP